MYSVNFKKVGDFTGYYTGRIVLGNKDRNEIRFASHIPLVIQTRKPCHAWIWNMLVLLYLVLNVLYKHDTFPERFNFVHFPDFTGILLKSYLLIVSRKWGFSKRVQKDFTNKSTLAWYQTHTCVRSRIT